MFLHLAEGLILAVLAGWLTGEENKGFFVIFGASTALFPDIDFLVYLHQRNWKVDKYAHEHRELLHRPLKVCFIGAIFFWYIWGFSCGLLWFLASTAHFVHDTLSDGWGIRWIPFDKRYFTLSSYSPKKIIANKTEQRKIVIAFGDTKWFEKESTINKETVREFFCFLAGLGFALWWIFG